MHNCPHLFPHSSTASSFLHQRSCIRRVQTNSRIACVDQRVNAHPAQCSSMPSQARTYQSTVARSYLHRRIDTHHLSHDSSTEDRASSSLLENHEVPTTLTTSFPSLLGQRQLRNKYSPNPAARHSPTSSKSCHHRN